MFKKATKKQCKLRLGLMGTAGSGKTYSALRLATGIGGKIALLDTERKSASKYADKFDFDVCDIANPTTENVITAIYEAEKAGYNVFIIDSATHVWKKLLEEIERLTSNKYNGNSYRAWGEGTPKQQKFIETLLNCNMHVIGTMRAKTEYVITSGADGKMHPKRVGMGADQGKDIEYEFDMLALIDNNHSVEIIKDRSGKYQGEFIDLLDENIGKEFADWLEVGEVEKPIPSDILKKALAQYGINVKEFCNHFDIKKSNIAEKIIMLDAMIDEYVNLGGGDV